MRTKRYRILVEDARFLAFHGECIHSAYKRLGYKTEESLRIALRNAKRPDIGFRLLNNCGDLEPSLGEYGSSDDYGAKLSPKGRADRNALKERTLTNRPSNQRFKPFHRQGSIRYDT